MEVVHFLVVLSPIDHCVWMYVSKSRFALSIHKADGGGSRSDAAAALAWFSESEAISVFLDYDFSQRPSLNVTGLFSPIENIASTKNSSWRWTRREKTNLSLHTFVPYQFNPLSDTIYSLNWDKRMSAFSIHESCGRPLFHGMTWIEEICNSAAALADVSTMRFPSITGVRSHHATCLYTQSWWVNNIMLYWFLWKDKNISIAIFLASCCYCIPELWFRRLSLDCVVAPLTLNTRCSW